MLLASSRHLLRASRLFSSSASTAELSQVLRDRINSYVAADKVVVFMKGTQQEPMCGFSRNVKMVLDFHEVKFRDYNVLEDQDLREGIKKFSEWPTIPQVYVNGTFVGGSDIIVSMHKEGEITDFFDEQGIPTKFSEKK
ncbi:hypothetical protein QR680_012349 [Steinernema hermaphroditum]|uniref:Glutaredoxin-related protein 5, mitochondrial n=1 Tax=Steinernema hermaphroditum TaxID=289476 RepID=A0AA39I4I2_9BILA|nr:hypothetical protein QR680_012349 [Steinernema hermaphroditum]